MREAPPSTPAPPRPPLKPPARNRQQRAPCHPCHCSTSAGESKARNDAQLPNERRRPLRLASPSQPAPISLSVHTLVVAALAAGGGRPKPIKPPPRDEPACSKQRTTICNDQCPSARRPKPAPQQIACHEKTQKNVGNITINDSLAPPLPSCCGAPQPTGCSREEIS